MGQTAVAGIAGVLVGGMVVATMVLNDGPVVVLPSHPCELVGAAELEAISESIDVDVAPGVPRASIDVVVKWGGADEHVPLEHRRLCVFPTEDTKIGGVLLRFDNDFAARRRRFFEGNDAYDFTVRGVPAVAHAAPNSGIVLAADHGRGLVVGAQHATNPEASEAVRAFADAIVRRHRDA